MASTWSALKIELLETGQNSGTWGTLTNVNLGDAVLGEAITGSATVDFPTDADVTVTLTDSATSQSARNLRLNITESSTGIGSVRSLILGSGCQIEKFYLINNTGTGAKTVKNTTGTGISVPAGKATLVYNNGTNVVDAASYFTSLTLGSALPVASGGTGLATLTANNVILGNGASAPTFVAPSTSGNVLTSNGTTWSSAAPATSGTVTSVAMTVPSVLSISGSPITSSGTLALTYSGTALPVANGGTGLTSGTSGGVLAYTATGTLASSAALAASALVIGGGAGAAPSTTTTGTGVVTALGVNTGTAGAFVVNGGALGSPSTAGTMPAFTLGGTVSGGGNQINNVVIGASTPLAGSFTTLGASSTATLNTLVSSGATLTGGTINGMTVGATTASTGAFTTVTATQANTSTTLGTAPFVNLINTATATLNQVTGLKFRQQDGVYNGEGVIATVRTSATARTQAFVFCPSNASGDPTEVLRLGDSTGAQVTGTLSATGAIAATVGDILTPAVSARFNSNNTRIGFGIDNSNGFAYLGFNINPKTVSATVTYDLSSYAVTQLRMDSGQYVFKYAAAGTAGADVTFSTAATLSSTGLVLTNTLSGGTSGTAYSFSGSAPATSLTLDSSGNLGIGTSSPNNTLSLKSETDANIRFEDTTSGVAGYVGPSENNQSDTTAQRLGIRGEAGVSFSVNTTTKMTLDSSGNLLVGTTAVPNVGITGQFGFSVSSTEVVISKSGADGLIIRTTSAASNNIRLYNLNSQVGSVSTTTTATAYNTSSDYRLKNTITPMTGALAKVSQLKPVTYKWNADGSDGEGFIAHELAEVVPDCVSGEKDAVNEDGSIKPQGIDTSFLVATLTAAIQEQQALITSLTARITALETA